MEVRQVAAEGAGINLCPALPALNHPCILLFPHVSSVGVSAMVGVGQVLGGDLAGSTYHSLLFLDVGF
jgi:hypothetical protein